ncbi:ATP-binding protein [Arthrobacter woluwensis]|uniref:ATP-binding protein n=1 Tax=Arthrobacter woluwensis TaxID=156980 RepID=UPI001FD55FE5|nr:ATP-binding protein [Arthrobacter woluwensis]
MSTTEETHTPSSHRDGTKKPALTFWPRRAKRKAAKAARDHDVASLQESIEDGALRHRNEGTVIEFPKLPGGTWAHNRPWKFASRLGYYDPAAPGILSSTRQMEATHLAVASPPTSHRGLLFGIDAESGWWLIHDPFSAYGDTLESPNVCFIGDIGQGKSSAMKTWSVLRQLLLGRRVVQIDRKFQKDYGGGEYTALARTLGVTPIKFRIGGGGVRINILDPRIAALVDEDPDAVDNQLSEDRVDAPAGQSMLLRAVTEEALGRPLTPKEGKAVREAHRQALRVGKAENRVPDIRDVLAALYEPDAKNAQRLNLNVAELKAWGLDPAFELERMIEDDLAGLIDGPTSEEVVLGGGLTVFDVSTLPEDGPALPIVMTIINTWLVNMLYRQSTPIRTVLNNDEAWHTTHGSVAKVNRRNTKLSRGIGLSCQFAFHHISDIPEDSPAIAMIKECGTVLIYRQSKRDDAEACEELFGLPPGSADVIRSLPKAHCLFKIGTNDPVEAIHLRSDLEVQLTDTDGAMLSTEHAHMTGAF